jgi:putative endonuclease
MEPDENLPYPDCAQPTVYVLSCGDGSLYTGATKDLSRRLTAHQSSGGAKYTRGRLPLKLIAWWHPASFDLAKSHEAQFKRLPRAAKLAMLGSGEAFGCRVFTCVEPQEATQTT